MTGKNTLWWGVGVGLLTIVMITLAELVPSEVWRVVAPLLAMTITGVIWFGSHLKKCGEQQLPPHHFVVIGSWLLEAAGVFVMCILAPDDRPAEEIPGVGNYVILAAIIAAMLHGMNWFFAKMAFTRLPRERRDLMDADGS